MNKSYKKSIRQVLSGASLVLLLTVAVVLAPFIATHDPYAANPENWLSPPGEENLLGTDRLGRDVFSRILYGGRVSLAVGILAMSFSLLIGTALGGVAGYFGGITDMLLMRITDVFLVFPTLFLVIALAAIFNANLGMVILIIGFTGWPHIARLVRGEFMKLRSMDYTSSARLLGASHFRTMWRHLLPNAAGPLLVAATLGVPSAIMAEAGLGYFGLGAQPPVPTWGNMLREAQQYIRLAWWYATFPGLAVFITVLAFNILGEGLRGVFNPREGERSTGA